MDDKNQRYHRQSIRLNEYDYTQSGAYFITMVTGGRVEIFGKIANGEMLLNAVGEMARREWQHLPGRFPGLELAAFQIMPNHVHGIILLPNTYITTDPVGAQRSDQPPVPGTLTMRPGPPTSAVDSSTRRVGSVGKGAQRRGANQ